MAIKFSQLAKTSNIAGTSLIPVVTIGLSSNVLHVATGDTLSSFIYNTISGNISTINSSISDLYANASAQNTTITTLSSGQSSQASAISTIQSQISTLQSNAATQDSQINSLQLATAAGVVSTVLVSAPLAKTGNAGYPSISMPAATSGSNGYLTSADWTTFNNKAPTANPTFTGTVTLATLNTGNIAPTANSISNIGSLSNQYNTIFARATSAQYADLAELYLADQEYSVGTVLMIGGEKEVTACQFGNRAIGAVSANPSYLMNSGLEGGTKVALKGRVPVRVIGAVRKGQNLIAGQNGTATAAVYHSSEVFAIALESSTDSGEKLIEALVL